MRRVLAEPDPQARLQMLTERLGRWRAAQLAYGLGPLIAAGDEEQRQRLDATASSSSPTPPNPTARRRSTAIPHQLGRQTCRHTGRTLEHSMTTAETTCEWAGTRPRPWSALDRLYAIPGPVADDLQQSIDLWGHAGGHVGDMLGTWIWANGAKTGGGERDLSSSNAVFAGDAWRIVLGVKESRVQIPPARPV